MIGKVWFSEAAQRFNFHVDLQHKGGDVSWGEQCTPLPGAPCSL